MSRSPSFLHSCRYVQRIPRHRDEGEEGEEGEANGSKAKIQFYPCMARVEEGKKSPKGRVAHNSVREGR